MNVLNYYVKTQGEGGITALFVIYVIIFFVTFLLKDDIERWCHMGLSKDNILFKHAKMAWLYVIIVVTIVFAAAGGSLVGSDSYIEATISDDYPLKAVYEDYEIVERRGEIWVLKERKKEPDTEIISEGKEVTEDDD